MYLFSAHDTTIVPLLVAFRIFDNKWPVYCANIAVELWQKNSGEHLVKISYCGKVSLIHEWYCQPLRVKRGLSYEFQAKTGISFDNRIVMLTAGACLKAHSSSYNQKKYIHMLLL